MGNITVGAVVLDYVVSFKQTNKTTIGAHKIPHKAKATYDVDCAVVDPETYDLEARVTTANKNLLHGYKASWKNFTYDEGTVNMWILTVDSEYQVGNIARPWITKMSMILSNS